MKYIQNPYLIRLLNFKSNTDIVNYIFNNRCNLNVINFIYFANYILLEENIEYLKALQKSDLVLIDGIGLQVHFKTLNNDNIYNNNGTDLLPQIINYCITNNHDLAFYGTTTTSIKTCYAKYKQDKNIYYAQNGYSDLKWNKIRDNSILFVGLGTPNQELWQLKNKSIIKKRTY